MSIPMTRKACKISVVLPIYNVAEYLRECMDSLLGQTLSEIEILCVDDCSTDGTVEILREYAEKDERVSLILHAENGTAAQCRKDGALASRGKYVLFVDPDDYLQRDACQELYALAEKHDVDVLHFRAKAFGTADVPKSRIEMIDRMLVPCFERLEGNALNDGCFLQKRFGFQIWNKLFRGDMCRRAMAEFPDGRFPKAQDLLAVYILLYYARSYIGVETKPMYMYRVGVGVTGGNILTRRQIDGYAVQSLIPEAIKAFLRARNALEQNRANYEAIYEQLLADCAAKLVHSVAPEDISYAWEQLCRAWGPEKMVWQLSCREDQEQEKWARALKGSPSLTFIPRATKRVGTFYHSLRNGGAQRVVAMLIGIWTKLGYEVTLFTDAEPTEEDYELPAGVERVVLGQVIPGSEEGRRERTEELYSQVRARGLDLFVYHAWISPQLFWDMLAIKSAGAAVYVHCHSVFSMLLLSPNNYRALVSTPDIYAMADGVIALSEVDQTYWHAYNTRAFVVKNPLTFRLKDIPVNRLEGENIVWVGRISPEKNPVDVIDIFDLVAQKRPEARLMVVGSGMNVFENRMRDRAAELQIADKVEFCGFQQDVAPFYARADVYLSTSQYEGAPVSLLEAQSFGLPVVTYDMPYLSILRTGLGSVRVPQGDKRAAAEAIIGLLADGERRRALGAEARRNIEENFDVDFAAMWREIIDSTRIERACADENAALKIAFDTMREHAIAALTSGSWKGITDSMWIDGRYGASMPQRGPCKMLRKKLRTFVNVLQNEGISAVKEVLRSKRQAN